MAWFRDERAHQMITVLAQQIQAIQFERAEMKKDLLAKLEKLRRTREKRIEEECEESRRLAGAVLPRELDQFREVARMMDERLSLIEKELERDRETYQTLVRQMRDLIDDFARYKLSIDVSPGPHSDRYPGTVVYGPPDLVNEIVQAVRDKAN